MKPHRGPVVIPVTTILIYTLFSIYDQRKDRALEELRMRQRDIADGLEEKNELIRELYHRVKNNLQLVLSMIRLTLSTLLRASTAEKDRQSNHR